MTIVKFLSKGAGAIFQQVAAIVASTGAGDADKIPQTDADGKLDNSFLNAVDTSAGSGDAAKAVLTDASGRIDASFMPVGIGADTASIQASEALAAGDYVNVWDSTGSFRVRKADASTAGKEAHGFVLAAVSSGANATVYFEGTNTQVTGMTAGAVYLDPANPGKGTNTEPTTATQIVQRLGTATSATSVNFEASDVFVLA